MTFGRRVAAEGVATALLLATVVGSGIMGERLAAGNTALALLANTIATGAILVALILAFGPISGAHLNPVVTLTAAYHGATAWPEAAGYVAAQIVGAIVGVIAAHGMFEEPAIALSRHAREGPAQMLSEGIATFGLVAVIRGCSRRHSGTSVAIAVGAYITAAYWFTASTSFANPAVTVARSLTDTFAGIHPVDVPAFIAAQVVGGFLGAMVLDWLVPVTPEEHVGGSALPAPAAPHMEA